MIYPHIEENFKYIYIKYTKGISEKIATYLENNFNEIHLEQSEILLNLSKITADKSGVYKID